MSVKRNYEWEKKPNTIKAYQVDRSVYYIQHGSGNNPNPDDDYYLLYWPNVNKDIESVSVFDTYSTKEEAIAGLEDKIEQYRE